MDLCGKCYQGFHEKCKSKQKDLLENKQKSFKTESSMQYPMFPPMFPYWPYPQNFTAMNMEQNLNKEG